MFEVYRPCFVPLTQPSPSLGSGSGFVERSAGRARDWFSSPIASRLGPIHRTDQASSAGNMIAYVLC